MFAMFPTHVQQLQVQIFTLFLCLQILQPGKQEEEFPFNETVVLSSPKMEAESFGLIGEEFDVNVIQGTILKFQEIKKRYYP